MSGSLSVLGVFGSLRSYPVRDTISLAFTPYVGSNPTPFGVARVVNVGRCSTFGVWSDTISMRVTEVCGG